MKSLSFTFWKKILQKLQTHWCSTFDLYNYQVKLLNMMLATEHHSSLIVLVLPAIQLVTHNFKGMYSPMHLYICTDASQGVASAISTCTMSSHSWRGVSATISLKVTVFHTTLCVQDKFTIWQHTLLFCRDS